MTSDDMAATEDARAMRPMQIVRAYGVSERQVRRLIRDGRLPAYRVGAMVLVPMEAVDALFGGTDDDD
jgi:excisionase family DNA binding protein